MKSMSSCEMENNQKPAKINYINSYVYIGRCRKWPAEKYQKKYK